MNPYEVTRRELFSGIDHPQGSDAALDAYLRIAAANYVGGYDGSIPAARFVADDIASFLGADHNFVKFVANQLNRQAGR